MTSTSDPFPTLDFADAPGEGADNQRATTKQQPSSPQMRLAVEPKGSLFALFCRPIQMTSACTMFGAMPLLLATGAGAESRQPIGIVVVFGVAVSSVFTLFVVPAL